MASEPVILKQPASHAQSALENPRDNRPEEGVSGKVAESNLESSTPSNPEVSSLIKVIEQLMTEKKTKASKLHSITTNALVVVLIGGLVGAFLTHYYALKQKEIDHNRSLQQLELTRQRSFSDELNKIRIQKIGEVWEQIDKNETTLDDLLDRANKASGSNEKDFDDIRKIIDEDLSVINKNRFWLGEPAYQRLKEYLNITGQYVSDMLLGHPGIDLSETVKRREQVKQDVLHIRNMFLKGEQELN